MCIQLKVSETETQKILKYFIRNLHMLQEDFPWDMEQRIIQILFNSERKADIWVT